MKGLLRMMPGEDILTPCLQDEANSIKEETIEKKDKINGGKKTFYLAESPVDIEEYVPKDAERVVLQKMNEITKSPFLGDRSKINSYHERSEYTSVGDTFTALFGQFPSFWTCNTNNGFFNRNDFLKKISKFYSPQTEYNKITGKKESWWFCKAEDDSVLFLKENETEHYTHANENGEAIDSRYYIFVLKRNIMLSFSNGCIIVFYINGNFPSEVLKFAHECYKSRKIEKKKRYLSVIITNSGGNLSLATILQKNGHANDTSFYNDDFKEVDKDVQRFLNNDETGIMIFHGIQGTGKTSYIRELMAKTTKKVVYMPAGLMDQIASPGFLGFAMQHLQDSIIVLEDCEELLISRENNNRPISSASYTNNALIGLLELGDGLLGDNISAKIICTFNTKLKNIDAALTRKGRLKVEYEFKPLEFKKADQLNKRFHLGVPVSAYKDGITLASLFNYKLKDYGAKPEKKKLGFNNTEQ